MVMKLTEENMQETSRELVLTVTANFTAEPIGDSLRFWMPRMALGTPRLQFFWLQPGFAGIDSA